VIKLAIFDVDGVLVPIKSSWQYVHEKLGTLKEAERNLKLFLEGKIGYWEWMYLDTLAWIEANPGITIWDLIELFKEVDVSSDGLCAAKLLHSSNIPIVLVSGGINILVEKVARRIGALLHFSPKLSFDYYGRLVPGGDPIVEADSKDKIVEAISKKLNIEKSEIAFIGDSIWDLKGMKAAGIAVAVNTSDARVLEVADIVSDNVCDAIRKLLQWNRTSKIR